MKKINLRDYYPYYTQDMIVEVPDEVALLLREYMLLEEAYRIRTYRYKAFYSLDRDEGIEREILQKPLNPAEIWEQRQMTELIYKGLSKLPVKQRQRIYAHFFLGMSKADISQLRRCILSAYLFDDFRPLRGKGFHLPGQALAVIHDCLQRGKLVVADKGVFCKDFLGVFPDALQFRAVDVRLLFLGQDAQLITVVQI